MKPPPDESTAGTTREAQISRTSTHYRGFALMASNTSKCMQAVSDISCLRSPHRHQASIVVAFHRHFSVPRCDAGILKRKRAAAAGADHFSPHEKYGRRRNASTSGLRQAASPRRAAASRQPAHFGIASAMKPLDSHYAIASRLATRYAIDGHTVVLRLFYHTRHYRQRDKDSYTRPPT